MLKLQYTENGLFMERIPGSLDAFIAQRVALVLRAGQSLQVQPGRASFLLPQDPPTLAELEARVWMEPSLPLAIYPVDVDLVEVSVEGTWMTEQVDAEEGTFVFTPSPQIEALLYQLWLKSTAALSVLP